MVGLALALGGCAGATYPTPIPGHAVVGTEAGSDLRAGPERAEDRAELVMDVTAEACVEEPSMCEERAEEVLAGMAWEYPDPDVQLPYSVWRFPTSNEQEVRTVGITVGISLSEQYAELQRGNTLTYPGNVDP